MLLKISEVLIADYVDIISYKSNSIVIDTLESLESDNVDTQCVGAPNTE